jgi:serine/threonine protein kinase
VPDSELELSELSSELLTRRLRGYRVLRRIGSGAMGLVYEAEQERPRRRIALKLLPPALALRERTVRRFLREAEAMGRLSHPNVVDVFEVGSAGSLHYFSMKFVEGPPLDRVLKAGPLAILDVISIGIDVAGALAHAHARGVMHRDVKPSNLLRDGERIVLTDFGLARPLESDGEGSMTESGDLVGTPLYMSPEQIGGDGDAVDGRADVWGLGVTLFELLTQRPPFTGANAQSILHAILHRDPPRLRRLRQDVPRDLEAVVLRCLEKDPARRYSGAAALLDDLKAVRDGQPVAAARPRVFDPALRWMRRHPWEAAVVAVSMGIALVVTLYWLRSSNLLSEANQTIEETVKARSEAQVEAQFQQRERTLASARSELAELRVLWSHGEERRREAIDRLEDLLDSLTSTASDTLPAVVVEAFELNASWMKEYGMGDEALANVEEHDLGRDPGRRLVLRAAVLSGLERFPEALAAHRSRAVREPRDPSPYLDAARICRRRAQAELARGDAQALERNLRWSLQLLQRAVRAAVERADADSVVDALIERARVLLDLGGPHAARLAREGLEQALKHDPSRVDGHALLRASQRTTRRDLARSAAAGEPGSGADAIELSLGRLLSGEALESSTLESAGRGLQGLYRGLHNALRKAALPSDPGAEPEKASVIEAADRAPPGAGSSDS